MTRMFKDYDNNSNCIPDNRYRFLPIKSQYRDLMVMNANNQYQFVVPYKSEDILDANVFYMQGTESVITKTYKDLILEDISEDADNCRISYYLSAEDTLLFNNYNKELKVQLKLNLFNGRIEYSPIYLIKIISSLDALNKENEDVL